MIKYNRSAIQNWVYFDIEVVREFKDYQSFSLTKNADLWKKANNKYYVDHIAEFGDKDIDEVCYEKNAAFFPEYGKIISVAFGTFSVDPEASEPTFKKEVGAVSTDDEKHLLQRTSDFLNAKYAKYGADTQLCGFNVIEFDIPYLVKRMIKHGVKVPRLLVNAVSAKPWDMKVVDVMRDWKFNGMKNTSLGTIEEFLDVPSSKTGEINGMNLGQKYWECNTEEERRYLLKKVGEYAKDDVSSMMDIVVKLCDA